MHSDKVAELWRNHLTNSNWHCCWTVQVIAIEVVSVSQCVMFYSNPYCLHTNYQQMMPNYLFANVLALLWNHAVFMCDSVWFFFGLVLVFGMCVYVCVKVYQVSKSISASRVKMKASKTRVDCVTEKKRHQKNQTNIDKSTYWLYFILDRMKKKTRTKTKQKIFKKKKNKRKRYLHRRSRVSSRRLKLCCLHWVWSF